MMEGLLEVLCSAREKAEQAEVFSLVSRTVSVQFEANELKQIQTKESSSLALRIFKEGRIGFATAGGECDLDTLVDMAVETSQFGSPANFQFPPRFHGDSSKVCIFDAKVGDLAKERMIDIGKELITKVRGHTPDILCDVEVTKRTSSISLVNSQGGEGRYDKSFLGFGLEGIVVRDTDMLFVGDSESSCRFDFIGINDLADRVIWQLEMAKKKATVSTKLLPIIFTPSGVASVLISPIMLAFNGKTVLEGASPLKDKLGKQVFDKKLSLWDDATVAFGVGSYPFDDEGVPSQHLPLITDGIVTNFLYDLQTAALAGTQSTGHGQRAGGGFPRPGISSLTLNRGDVSFQAMVEDMKEGLIVEQVIGAEQGNVLSGDFGGNVLLGYKVENGEIVGRVKDTVIAGNVYQVLKELLGIGQETRWVGGILQTPSLYCPRVSVTTKGS
ncbi:MAG: TldD/PmbA family protein [Dehalococcoidia bacterium]|nr:TldD/PmbA family protein [Dehalococcoidia bacterium]RLC65322.1 MAG: TldD/PmbA family protein [Chloroflexota bacterium]